MTENARKLRLEVWNYDKLCVAVTITLPDHLEVGQEIEINFDSSPVEMEEGTWGEMHGEYGFPIHWLKNINGNPVIAETQLAVSETESEQESDDEYG